MSHRYGYAEKKLSLQYAIRLAANPSNPAFEKKKVREKSRGCHNHKPQPFPDPKKKRKPTNLNKHKPNKRTKSTKNSSLFPKRGNRNTKSTEVTFPPQFQEYYERKPNAIKSFGLRIAPCLESANINTKNIQKHSFSDIPSCCITKPSILFDLPTAKSHFLINIS